MPNDSQTVPIEIFVLREALSVGEVYFTLKGHSMLPTIEPGFRLQVGPVRGLILNKLYLFIQYTSGEPQLVCHRLLRIFDEGICLFKGDNRTLADPLVGQSNIIGEVYNVK